MFPNIRLVIVATMASIVGISCGLALFAAFRVNHEPLARFANGGPPLRLAFDDDAPDLSVAPFGVRFPVNASAAPETGPILVTAPDGTPSDRMAPADQKHQPAEAGPPAIVATVTPLEQPPAPAAPVAQDQKSVPAAKAAAPASPRKHVAKLRRIRRARARPIIPSSDQLYGNSQTSFQFTSVALQPARVRRAAGNSVAPPPSVQ
jgi:hypothetical protein